MNKILECYKCNKLQTFDVEMELNTDWNICQNCSEKLDFKEMIKTYSDEIKEQSK